MQVKTFIGPSTQSVLAQVKAELGPSAIILSSRDFQKDGQRQYEVTAGIDRPITSGGNNSNNLNGESPPQGWDEWFRDWTKVKEHLYALMQPSIQWERLSSRQRTALEYLQREEVDDAVIMELYHRLSSVPGSSPFEALSEIVPIRPWSAESWPERIQGITGPFGAGKTTSALRMALLLRKTDPSIRIGFINADCERANSRLVLKHWAELSEFGYFEASDPESMEKVIEQNEDKDYLFIDFPGISNPKETLTMQLSALGLSSMEFVVHLALPPHYATLQNQAFLSKYQSQHLSSIVWTKLDEAATYGSIVNVAMATGLPISALSYGIGLSDTLSSVYESVLWKLVFKHQLPGQV